MAILDLWGGFLGVVAVDGGGHGFWGSAETVGVGLVAEDCLVGVVVVGLHALHCE